MPATIYVCVCMCMIVSWRIRACISTCLGPLQVLKEVESEGLAAQGHPPNGALRSLAEGYVGDSLLKARRACPTGH